MDELAIKALAKINLGLDYLSHGRLKLLATVATL